MQLPMHLQEKINELYSKLPKKKLTETRAKLTKKYKEQTGASKSLISSNEDSLVYSISRMPATFSVIFSLVKNLLEQGFLSNIKTIADIGAGTGAGYFALSEIFEDVKFSLYERDNFMINAFNELSGGSVKVVKTDIVKDDARIDADLVISSYVLSEMSENDRLEVVRKVLPKNNGKLLLIDTGTPEVYKEYMRIKDFVQDLGYFVVAPCVSKKCTLENDYCQFYARVERSSLHKQIKEATLSYEDEKYFYLLIQKDDAKTENSRVLRRPRFAPNMIEHTLCTAGGVVKKIYTKKDKELYKSAKKTDINGLIG